MTIAAMMTTMSVSAQRIQVVDSNGEGIPLVSVLTEDGIYIGKTDLDGVLSDVKGATKVGLTHVAYKPKLVTVASLPNGRVEMEDLNFSIAEVVIKPKPYIYVEAYYRVYVYRNDSLGYYHCGIMPNAYNQQKKKFEHGSYNNCYVEYYPSFGVAVTWGARADQNRAGQIRMSNAPSKEKLKTKYFVTTDDRNPNHWVFSIPEGIVGQLVRNGNQVRTTLNAGKIQMYANKVKGEKKVLAKREEIELDYQFTLIGNNKQDGEEADITDFIMETNHWEYTDKKGHAKFIIECYATIHDYLDQNDLNTKKKELKNRYKRATLEDMEAYERQHGIPNLPATVRQSLRKLKHDN